MGRRRKCKRRCVKVQRPVSQPQLLRPNIHDLLHNNSNHIRDLSQQLQPHPQPPPQQPQPPVCPDCPEIQWNQLRVDLVALGAGHFGEVFKGTWQGKPVAVKVVRATFEKVQKEALKSIGLSHPNVVQVFGVTRDPVGLVLEYVQGVTLETLINEWNFEFKNNPNLALDILIGVCRGLNYLHSLPNPVVHRDIKPDNIMIDGAFQPKIIDFGVAQILTLERPYIYHYTHPWPWSAPEVISDERHNQSADIYSFGLLMWHLFTLNSEQPFSVSERQILQGHRPQIPAVVSQKFKDIMQKCWVGNRHARPDAATLLGLLLSLR